MNKIKYYLHKIGLASFPTTTLTRLREALKQIERLEAQVEALKNAAVKSAKPKAKRKTKSTK